MRKQALWKVTIQHRGPGQVASVHVVTEDNTPQAQAHSSAAALALKALGDRPSAVIIEMLYTGPVFVDSDKS